MGLVRKSKTIKECQGKGAEIKKWLETQGRKVERQFANWGVLGKKRRDSEQIESPSSDSSATGSSTPSIPTRGLVNFGNTCYCNAVIQALFHCDEFRVQFLQQHLARSQSNERRNSPPGNENVRGAALVYHLGKVFEELLEPGRKRRILRRNNHLPAVKPKKFINEVQSNGSSFKRPYQHDAHEFLNYLINICADNLQDEITKKCIVGDIFMGTLVHKTSCILCHDGPKQSEIFYDVSLDV
ncbi:hypothetical protein ACOME3_002734 [Neoechinorhynchus agilis]